MRSVSTTIRLSAPDAKDPINPYHVGQSFYLAGHRALLDIAVGPGKTQYLAGPGVSMLCFSIELFMKSLILATGAEPPRTHNLEELFACLPDEAKASIRQGYERSVLAPSLDDLLAEIARFFEKLRYEYEHDIFSFNEGPVIILAKAAYIYCSQKYESTNDVSAVNL